MFYHNVKRLSELSRDTWLPEPVRATLEQSHERYSYRRIWRMLHDRGIRRCAKRVMRPMRGTASVPSAKAGGATTRTRAGTRPSRLTSSTAASTPRHPTGCGRGHHRIPYRRRQNLPLPRHRPLRRHARHLEHRHHPTAGLANSMLEQARATLKTVNTRSFTPTGEATTASPNGSASANATG